VPDILVHCSISGCHIQTVNWMKTAPSYSKCSYFSKMCLYWYCTCIRWWCFYSLTDFSFTKCLFLGPVALNGLLNLVLKSNCKLFLTFVYCLLLSFITVTSTADILQCLLQLPWWSNQQEKWAVGSSVKGSRQNTLLTHCWWTESASIKYSWISL